VWHLAEFHSDALPYPQVYYNSMDIQWMRLEEYGNHVASNSIQFFGAMGGEGTTNDSAHSAHQALWGELNQPSPASAHSPNHAAQGSIANATLQFARGHGLHDH
jgi:hypothetical protein